MKRLFFLIGLFMMALLLAAPVMAQDGGSAEWSRTDIILIGALFVAGVAVTFLSATVILFGRQLFQSAPPWVGNLLEDNLQRAIDELNRIAEETPNAIDDALVNYFDERLREILQKARDDGGSTPPTQ